MEFFLDFELTGLGMTIEHRSKSVPHISRRCEPDHCREGFLAESGGEENLDNQIIDIPLDIRWRKGAIGVGQEILREEERMDQTMP